jgi:hypothetical protein
MADTRRRWDRRRHALAAATSAAGEERRRARCQNPTRKAFLSVRVGWALVDLDLKLPSSITLTALWARFRVVARLKFPQFAMRLGQPSNRRLCSTLTEKMIKNYHICVKHVS